MEDIKNIYEWQLITLPTSVYARDYQTNKVYNFRYKKSKDPDAYFRRHETELTLFDGAENMLKRFGINPKNLDLEQLQADYNALQAKKIELQKTYKSAEKEVADLNRKLANTLSVSNNFFHTWFIDDYVCTVFCNQSIPIILNHITEQEIHSFFSKQPSFYE